MTDLERGEGHLERGVEGDGTAGGLSAAVETMRAVRERCVWSQQITHDDLVPYLVEESAELIDAVEAGTRADLREELGDLLWQVLFHAAIAAEDPDDPFDIDDVATGLTEKMVRRHPHVFADAVATTPDEVLIHWNAAKAAEKRDRRSVLDGVSPHMPSLALAQKILGRAAALADPVARATSAPAAQATSDPAAPSNPSADPARPRFRVETAVLGASPAAESGSRGLGETRSGAAPASEAELGEALLALVATARAHGWDADRALRGAIRGLEAEIRTAEGR